MADEKIVTFPVEATHIMMFRRSIGDYGVPDTGLETGTIAVVMTLLTGDAGDSEHPPVLDCPRPWIPTRLVARASGDRRD